MITENKLTIYNDKKDSDLRIDEVDIKLIKELKKDGRISLVKLGKRLGMRHSSVRNRLMRLIKEGYLRIQANLGIQKLKLQVAFVFLDMRDSSILLKNIKRLINCPRIVMIGTIMGEYNFLIILVGKGFDEIQTFIERNLRPLESLRKLSIVYGEIVYPEYLPLNIFNDVECDNECERCEVISLQECKGSKYL